MDSRERVKRAIDFRGPDHIPHFLPDGKENDLIWLWQPKPADILPWTEQKPGIFKRIDCWSIVWHRQGSVGVGEAKEYPVRTVDDYVNYQIPELNAPEFYEHIRNVVEANNTDLNPKYCLSVLQYPNLFERLHTLMGLDNLMMAFYDHPGELRAFLRRLADKQLESIKKVADCGCDGIMMFEDWGIQDRLIISREMICDFFLPHYRQAWSLAHKLGMDTWMHSCGYIVGILQDFIDAGLDVIQMDQQQNMGLDVLADKFGGKIAFWCPVDIQGVMCSGSISDVVHYVRQMKHALGSYNGGLVSKYYPDPASCGHSEANIKAMCDAFRHHEQYTGSTIPQLA